MLQNLMPFIPVLVFLFFVLLFRSFGVVRDTLGRPDKVRTNLRAVQFALAYARLAKVHAYFYWYNRTPAFAGLAIL